MDNIPGSQLQQDVHRNALDVTEVIIGYLNPPKQPIVLEDSALSMKSSIPKDLLLTVIPDRKNDIAIYYIKGLVKSATSY